MFTLITGGSASGKSEYAENLAVKTSRGIYPLFYIATMIPYDKECEKRIVRHQLMRKEKKFTTVECQLNLSDIICNLPEQSVVLLECMSNLTANELYEKNGAKKKTVQKIIPAVKKLSEHVSYLIIVTNEVFSDGISYDNETMYYLETLGKINQELACFADEVIEVVVTIPVFHKSNKVSEK